MSDYLTTKEVADLLRLRERKVYDLASRGEIPCMKATGKLLFPKDELNRWMASRGGSARSSAAIPDVVLGSHDPILEWALGASGSALPSLMGGSLDGLARFERGEGTVCGIHIPDTDGLGWNLETITDRFADRPVVLINWALRERGLIIRPGVPVHNFADLRGVRVVRRQTDSGTHQLFEKQLAEAGLALADIECIREARTETEAALTLVEGQADVTFGLRCFAERYGLNFIATCTESFDLLIDRHGYFEPPVQRLLHFAGTTEFASEAERYAGYDVSTLGTVRFNGLT